MKVSSVRPPLSNVQAELLKVFSADIPDKHLAELKNLIARFYLTQPVIGLMRCGMKRVTLMNSFRGFLKINNATA